MSDSAHPLRTLFIWLFLLILLLAAVFIVAGVRTSSTPTLSEAIRTGEAPRPVLTETTKQKLSASKGFQVLVSYTDRGFEPVTLVVKKGDTARFTNNSSHNLQVRVGEGTSEMIVPQDFWEYTFERAGDIQIANTLDASKTAEVHVQ